MSAHILLVDDDPILLQMEQALLKGGGYRFTTAGDGLDCLARIQAERPDIILLDIIMPGMDGLETCRRIRAAADNAAIYIIFVSAMNDAESRLAAYDAGGDDFMLKPIQASEIRHKVEMACKSRQEVDDLRRNLSDTMSMAMTALSASGEMGVILHFFSRSIACQSMESLAGAVLDGFSSYGLSASVQLKYEGGPLTLNSQRRCSLIEQELLTNLSQDTRRVFDYGTRTVINFPHVCVLVKNMPVDEPERHGRMKDNAVLLTEGAEHRLQALASELAARRRQQRLATVVRGTEKELAEVREDYHRDQSELALTLTQLEQKLEAAFNHLALSETQETYLLEVVRPLAKQAQSLDEHNQKNDERLRQILGNLSEAIGA